MKFATTLLLAALGSAPLLAADGADSSRIGLLITSPVFQPAALPRSFMNDRIRDALELPESGPVRAFDFDFDGDGLPERLLISAEKLCNEAGCAYTLLDGKTQKEIGSFFGRMVVLDRKVGAWPVVQTLGKTEDGLTPLTSYSFQRVQYQADDAVMVDESALDLLLYSLRLK